LKSFRKETALQLDPTVVVPDEDSQTIVAITNNGGYTDFKLDADTEVGHVEEFEQNQDGKWKKSAVQVMTVQSVNDQERGEKLM